MTKIALISTGAGILVGAVAGYLYYRYIGCNSGTCVITSKPLNSLYMEYDGRLVFNMFVKRKSNHFFLLSLLTKWLDYKVTTQ
jgi:hypothetical protein